jgi:NitT/TauT family transport system substrate-binding protein
MRHITRRQAVAVTAGGAVSLAMARAARSQPTKKQVRFATEFAWEGNHGLWTLAKDRGYFSDQGIDVVIDRGYGAANNITKLVSRTLDIAVVDPNLLPKFNKEHPESALIAFSSFMTPRQALSSFSSPPASRRQRISREER